MELLTGVFGSQGNAESAVRELHGLGITRSRIGILSPNSDPEWIEKSLPISDTEAPGMGAAMGAAVGGAMGAAGGATLGLAVATLAIPGVGPVLAFGVLGAALLGVGGAAAGAAVGGTVEEGLGEGLPHEDAYLYEHALRHGHTVIIVYAEEGDQADRATEILLNSGAEDLDELRDAWWAEHRETERTHYQQDGRDFTLDELNYRRGFEASLNPTRRSQTYSEVEAELERTYGDISRETAFRQGYERGHQYLVSRVETPIG
jgi:hypothetical protein